MENDQKTFLAIAALAVGSVLLYKKATASTAELFTLSQFISPLSVADIAAQLPQDEDEFIIAAWDLVGNSIIYDGYGSEIKIADHTVICDKCLLAPQVLEIGRANCVGKSVLLTSLLRNRIPAGRVYMAIGHVAVNGTGGHAWVITERNGIWYLLESTRPPNGWQVADAHADYVVEALVNDRDVVCNSKDMCLSVKKSDCSCLRQKPY